MDKKFWCKDRKLSVILLVIAAFFAWQANNTVIRQSAGDPGPKLFPWIGCGILVLCAILLFIKPGPDGKKMNLNKEEKKRLIIMLGLYLLIVVGGILIGITYILPIALFIISFLFSKSSRPDMSTKKRIITTLIYTVLLSAAIYLIYVVVLDVALKPGILF